MSTLQIIRDCCKEQVLLEMTYEKAPGVFGQYFLEPYSFKPLENPDSLMAFDISTNAIKRFKFGKIRQAWKTARKYSPKYPIDIGS